MADQAVKLDIIIGAVNKARPALNGLKVDISGITNVARTAATALSRIALGGAALGGGVVTGLGYITKGFAEAAMEAENFKTMLVTALKTPEAADEMFAWAKKFADTTPFDTGPVIDAVTRLVNQGFDPKVWLEPIGNLAAANPTKGIIDAVEAFTDATRGEWERIKEFGLNSAALKAAGWSGKTEDAEGIMSSLRKVLDDRYAGGMARLSKTTAGALSNLRGTIWDLKVAVGSTLLPALNKLTSWLSDNIGRIKEFAKAWAGWLTENALNAVDKALSALDRLKASLSTVGADGKTPFRRWLDDAKALVSYARETVGPSVERLIAAAFQKDGAGGEGTGAAGGAPVGGALMDIGKVIIDVVAALVDSLATIAKSARESAGSIARLVGEILSSGVIPAVKIAATVIAKALGPLELVLIGLSVVVDQVQAYIGRWKDILGGDFRNRRGPSLSNPMDKSLPMDKRMEAYAYWSKRGSEIGGAWRRTFGSEAGFDLTEAGKQASPQQWGELQRMYQQRGDSVYLPNTIGRAGVSRVEHIVTLPSEWRGTRTAQELANNAAFSEGVVRVVYGEMRQPTRGR